MLMRHPKSGQTITVRDDMVRDYENQGWTKLHRKKPAPPKQTTPPASADGPTE